MAALTSRTAPPLVMSTVSGEGLGKDVQERDSRHGQYPGYGKPISVKLDQGALGMSDP